MAYGSPDAYISMISGLVGALIGGFFTLKAAIFTHHQVMRKEEAAEKEKMLTTLMLIRTEVATAWKLVKDEYANQLLDLRPDTPYLTFFPLGASPFPIFDSGPQALNLLPQALANDVVKFYLRAKGLIAMIELNNRSYHQALEHGRSLLTRYTEQAREQGRVLPDDMRDEIFNGGTEYMASHIGMSDTANGMRALCLELEIVVNRITVKVNELFFPPSDHHTGIA